MSYNIVLIQGCRMVYLPICNVVLLTFIRYISYTIILFHNVTYRYCIHEYMIVSIYHTYDVSCIQRKIFLRKYKMSVVVMVEYYLYIGIYYCII